MLDKQILFVNVFFCHKQKLGIRSIEQASNIWQTFETMPVSSVQFYFTLIQSHSTKLKIIHLQATCTNGLLTRCEGHTEKYRTAVLVQPELARAVLKDQGPVFSVWHEQTMLINRLLYDWTE